MPKPHPNLRSLLVRLGLMGLLLFAALGPQPLASLALAEGNSGSGGGNSGSGNKDKDDKEKEKREKEERERKEREERERREREERERREQERRKEEERRRQNPQAGNPGSPNQGPGNPANPNSGPGNSNNPANSAPRSYFAQVTLNASGQVLCGDTRVQSDSPWLKLAAPGMWLEASGTWDGNTFKADEVQLRSPQAWSFYQGPASLVGAGQYQFVSAWLSTNRADPFIALRAAPDQTPVRVVAYYDGSKLRAVPASFPAPPAGLKVGWVELTGTVSGQSLVWNSAKAFP